MGKVVANPGSTLGEAIGAVVEQRVHTLIRPIAEDLEYGYNTVGRPDPRTGKPRQLKVCDDFGNEYLVDAVVVNERSQPIALIESKYIRYTKHNRDKASWICNAHLHLRRRFPTIRQSIAVLVGRWSQPSKIMLSSFGTTYFEVGFDHLAETLSQSGIDVSWKEKDRDKAHEAWQRWEILADHDYARIGEQLLQPIEQDLSVRLKDKLAPAAPRVIEQVEIVIRTSLGEMRRYPFTTLEAATTFLDALNPATLLADAGGPALWDKPSIADETD